MSIRMPHPVKVHFITDLISLIERTGCRVLEILEAYLERAG
jgi:hypothetical protein